MRCSYPLPDGLCDAAALGTVDLPSGRSPLCADHLGARLVEMMAEGWQSVIVRRVSRWTQARAEATIAARELAREASRGR